MKTKFALLLVFCAISLNIFAQEKKIKDRRTNPELYYLEESEVANSLELLPPPPEAGSILFLYDKARYDWGKLQRDTPRGEQAVSDARVNGDGVPFAFSEAFGIEITRDKTPELYRLIINMREDAGDLATRHAKEYYMRVRPFSFFNEMTCNPEQQEELSTNGSYPSGHTAIGWATALVLAEINPDRQNEILKRGLFFILTSFKLFQIQPHPDSVPFIFTHDSLNFNFISTFVISGYFDNRQAAAPETTGAAIDVPVFII